MSSCETTGVGVSTEATASFGDADVSVRRRRFRRGASSRSLLAGSTFAEFGAGIECGASKRRGFIEASSGGDVGELPATGDSNTF
jgi:hypothetical protein